MDKVGCTNQFLLDKSQICTDPEDVKKAWKIFNQFRHNQTLVESLCPRSCQYQNINLARYNEDTDTIHPEVYSFIGGDPLSKTLEVTFQKYVKLSVARPAYTFLELIAEVGGYVGLFLGVSINQLFNLLSNLSIVLYSIIQKITQ